MTYLDANKTAGYSGWILYADGDHYCSYSVWMIPGTFFHDWDNQ